MSIISWVMDKFFPSTDNKSLFYNYPVINKFSAIESTYIINALKDISNYTVNFSDAQGVIYINGPVALDVTMTPYSVSATTNLVTVPNLVNGSYSLQMQTDGNLVVYGPNNAVIWSASSNIGMPTGYSAPYNLVVGANGILNIVGNTMSTGTSDTAAQMTITGPNRPLMGYIVAGSYTSTLFNSTYLSIGSDGFSRYNVPFSSITTSSTTSTTNPFYYYSVTKGIVPSLVQRSIWSNTTVPPTGVAPYRLLLLGTGKLNIVDANYSVVWTT